jgi:hypothetical protein
MAPDWPQIIAHYRRMRADTEMNRAYQRAASGVGDVAEYIGATWLQRCLFGHTSHYDLCIYQTAQRPTEAFPYLRIEALGSGDVQFRYIDSVWRMKQWHRVVPPEQTVPRFKRFLDQLHWISASDALKQLDDRFPQTAELSNGRS